MFSELDAPKEITKPTLKTLNFIKENAALTSDQAALKASRNPEIDVHYAINQIAGRKIAQTKLPLWAKYDDIVYPVHLSLEQCSSQATAQYKASIVKKLIDSLGKNDENAHTLVDLTGGFGVDCTILSDLFQKTIYFEQQPELASIVQHNMRILGKNNVYCFNTDSTTAISSVSSAPSVSANQNAQNTQSAQSTHKITMIYVDPARRNSHGSRTYAIEDCTPNVLLLKQQLLSIADFVMIKLSPMLDWRKTIADFKGNVSQLHIVSCENECKELLIILDNDIHTNVVINCVNDDQLTTFYAKYDLSSNRIEIISRNISNENNDYESRIVNNSSANSLNDYSNNSLEYLKNYASYVYEPNASIMKSGCFELLTQLYAVKQISSNSHVFVSQNPIKQFPGKMLAITNICSMNKRDLKEALNGITYANIAVRNFPMSVDALRKKLRVKDGGQTRIIATTDSTNRHILILAKAE